jgi:hypothetical protein
MGRLAKLGAMILLLYAPVPAQYQTIELADTQVANSVGAIVQDPNGSAIPGASVAEFAASWKTVLRSTSTDIDGRFSFNRVRSRDVYFIQISARGFDPLRFRLKLDPKHGISLRLKLTVATWMRAIRTAITVNIASPVPSSSDGPRHMLGAIPSARLLDGLSQRETISGGDHRTRGTRAMDAQLVAADEIN